MAAKGKLYQAPVDKPQRVLDVGTGTGIWAMDFGELVFPDLVVHSIRSVEKCADIKDSAHEEAYVIGTDLSPIQPTWWAFLFILQVRCTVLY